MSGEVRHSMPVECYDLAIVGAGVAGTYIGDRVKRARSDWSVAIFERTDRIGGRLRSVSIAGLDHPIELGGMRFMSSHRRVASIVNEFALPTHPFDGTQGPGPLVPAACRRERAGRSGGRQELSARRKRAGSERPRALAAWLRTHRTQLAAARSRGLRQAPRRASTGAAA